MQAMETDRNLFWYAIKTNPKQEAQAERSLRSLNFETFAPMIHERSQLRIGTESGHRLAPLFPGYIFASFSAEHHLPSIRMARGVQAILSFGNGPAQVDDSVITLLRARVAELERPRQRETFQPGDRVVIQDGLLCGLTGIFARKMGGSERVAVLLSVLNSRARIVLDAGSIARVDPVSLRT